MHLGCLEWLVDRLFHPWPAIFHSDSVLPASVALDCDSMRPAIAFGCHSMSAAAAFDNYFLPGAAASECDSVRPAAFDSDSVPVLRAWACVA